MGADILNDDTLLHIFRLLDFKDLITVMQVCRRWRRVAEYKPLWKYAHVSFKNPEEETFSYQCLKLAPSIAGLRIGGLTRCHCPEEMNNTKKILSKIIKYHPKDIRVLRLDRITRPTSEEQLLQLMRCICENLQEVHIDYVNIQWNKDSQRKLTPGNFPRLKRIVSDADFSQKMTATSALYPQLEVIYLREVEENSIVDLLKNQPVLRELTSQIKRLELHSDNIGWQLVHSFDNNYLNYFPSIESFFFDATFSYLEWSIGDVKSLSIDFDPPGQKANDWDWLEFFDDEIPNMRLFNSVHDVTLKFSFPYEKSVSILEKLPDAKKLTLHLKCSLDCGRLSYLFMELFKFARKAVTYLNKLTVLNIKGCSMVSLYSPVLTVLFNVAVTLEVVEKCFIPLPVTLANCH